MKTISHCLRSAGLAAGLLASSQVAGQRGIALSPGTYGEPALPIAAPALPLAAPALLAPAPAGSARYAVSAADHTVREALARWASQAGWVHEPIHWAVDRDFPVAGAAGAETFGGDFKDAVRILLSSTELTDRPVQPCFYSNRVVRVVPKAEPCDKTLP